MTWDNLKKLHPHSWVLIENISSTTKLLKKTIEELSVVGIFDHLDSTAALYNYLEMHKKYPERELYVVHTSMETLEIEEQRWIGVKV